jgi:hypothetical protein
MLWEWKVSSIHEQYIKDRKSKTTESLNFVQPSSFNSRNMESLDFIENSLLSEISSFEKLFPTAHRRFCDMSNKNITRISCDNYAPVMFCDAILTAKLTN